MKKMMSLLSVLALSLLLLQACEPKSYAAYACPMKCEGEKTYAQAGSCPVCGMKLQGVSAPAPDSAQADSGGHP